MDAPLGKKALDEKIKIDAAKKVVTKIEKDKPEIIDRDSQIYWLKKKNNIHLRGIRDLLDY